ncbi:MAG: hypothetical protein LBF15_01845 [Candidatus Peribacteria bacterium]|nr:hypothetical protein [Candidatus Peribacteria bacterium]
MRGLTGKDLEVRVLTEEGWKMRAYKKFITPYTALIDLNQTKEEILAKMKPK